VDVERAAKKQSREGELGEPEELRDLGEEAL
jgi:hypothetical protein